MKLFRHEPMSLLKPERAHVLSDFLEKARTYLLEIGSEAEYLVDVICGCESGWDEVLEQSWAKEFNPLIDTKGNLDFLAVLMADGQSLCSALTHACKSGYENLQKELGRSGLHYLHFRMGLRSPADRMKYTLKFADELFQISPSDYRSALDPLQGISVLSRKRGEAVDCFFDNFNYRPSPQKRLSKSAFRLLLGEREVANSDEFGQALEVLLLEVERKFSQISRSRLALRIEKALIPLVYNYGYLLKTKGMSDDEICDKVSTNVDGLLGFMQLERNFSAALKRQILINLLSPFPDGLVMLHARPEELQGVMLDPVLINRADADLFDETLKGPMRLFKAGESVTHMERCTQIIEFFKDSDTPLNFSCAIHGRLAPRNLDIVSLFSSTYASGYSEDLENALTGKAPEVVINDPLLMHLMHPVRLSRYCDTAVIKLIDLTFNYCKKQARIAGSGVRTVGFRKVGPIFDDRPHLREDVLDLMSKKDLLTPKIFEWCGFDHRELKMLGRRAPNALKQFLLEGAIGL